MLFNITTDEIGKFKEVFDNGYECFLKLCEEEGIKGVSYPTLKYASDVETSWKEFELCFHKDRENIYHNMLRPKFKSGNVTLRV